ncbi:imidazolonepropionase-like amidohydrolase [Catenulispora sp. GP43]|uniref:amidohydrolase family protein n=1 Tax=Catenulispora sp. GP43 TaxID=3156263 RepID=UPI0035179D6C
MTATHLTNVHIFDGVGQSAATTVTIEGQLITAVGAAQAPQGADVVDARGASLLPGLIDAHVHTSIDSLRDALRFGVTTELEMQGFWTPEQRIEVNADDTIADVRSALLALMAKGGHPSELMHDLGEHEPGAEHEGWEMPSVSTPDEARAHVQRFAQAGADYIKVMIEEGTTMGHPGLPVIDSETLRAGVDEAHKLGLKVIAHATTLDATRQALDVGIDGLAHLFIDQRADQAIIAALADADVFVTPCLVVSASLMGRDAAADLAADPRVSGRLSQPWLDTLRGAYNTYPQGTFQHVLDSVAALHAAGVDILAGTDASIPVPTHGGVAHGASMHHELALLVQAGLSTEAALAAATSVPARCFNLADRGRIAPGLRADLLLVDGNPLDEITHTLDINTVWRRGACLK